MFFYTNFRKFCSNMLLGPVLGLWVIGALFRSCSGTLQLSAGDAALWLPVGAESSQEQIYDSSPRHTYPLGTESLVLFSESPTGWVMKPMVSSCSQQQSTSEGPHLTLSASSICPSGERGVLKESHPVRIKINKLHRKSQ